MLQAGYPTLLLSVHCPLFLIIASSSLPFPTRKSPMEESPTRKIGLKSLFCWFSSDVKIRTFMLFRNHRKPAGDKAIPLPFLDGTQIARQRKEFSPVHRGHCRFTDN